MEVSRAERWLIVFLVAYALFFVYGSLAPLHWHARPWLETWNEFMARPGPSFGLSERIDAAVNFLLPVPLTYGLAHLARRVRAPALRLLAWACLWPLAAGLSVSVEFAQMFFDGRDASWSDVVAQWAGALCGLLLFAVTGRRFGVLLDGLGAHQPPSARFVHLLWLWLALVMIFSVMPLDLSPSPVELYRKWRAGRVVLIPFSGHGPDWAEAVYGWLSDVLIWVPVGLLWCIDGRSRSLRAAVQRTLLAAALIEGAQLFVMSRVSDVTDILLAGVGGAVGVALSLRGRVGIVSARRLGMAWFAWLAVAAALLWFPFDFSAERASLGSAVRAFTRLPFQTYLSRGEFGALSEIARKLLVFLPGGLLLGLWAARRERPPGVAIWVSAVLLPAFGLEAGQLLLPGKVADLTDALLAVLGACLGWLAAALVSRPALSPAVVAVRSADAMPTTNTGTSTVWAGYAAGGVTVVSMTLLLWIGARMPGVPYNVAKLMPSGPRGGIAALGLAVVLWFVAAAPLWSLWPQRRAWRLASVAWLAGQALLAFLVLRASVPLPMLHKVIGSPILGGAGPWEDLGRYLALHVGLMTPLFGGMLLVAAVWRAALLADFFFWLIGAAVLAWPLHAVVVEHAATDNLIELMRGGGSFLTSLALAGAVFFASVAASGASLATSVGPARRRPLGVLAALALPLGPALLWAGLEPSLFKYGREFSALQFMLSSGRDAYASGAELALRFAVAFTGLEVMLVALQRPLWRDLVAAWAGTGRAGPSPA
jgi:VanZ family protein